MSSPNLDVQRTKISATTPPKIRLIPWDADSEDHIQRMVDQRKTCGWKQDAVLDGDDNKLKLHLEAYVEERLPLADSAISLGGGPRSPTQYRFSPIGHISLDSVNSDPELGDKSKGLYSINTFYISRALQSSGIGRAAMDEIEAMTQREPLNAKTLALLTVANDFPGRDEKLKAQGKTRPLISLQDWYKRRGYVVFKQDQKAWEEEDLEGKMWPFAAVFMKKELGAGKG